jgi:hypothetical protein
VDLVLTVDCDDMGAVARCWRWLRLLFEFVYRLICGVLVLWADGVVCLGSPLSLVSLGMSLSIEGEDS